METMIWPFILVGFLAQMIDGALGMAYGVSSTTFLLSLGISPVVASASVHAAEVFTTGVSGISHWRLGNVDIHLVRRLVLAGVLGSMTGAYLLTTIDGNILKPFVAIYLLVMGVVILIKSLRQPQENNVTTHLFPLGLIGGFFDAIGGGGWGPIVTTTLVARGHSPRITIGSVNLVEFFVSFAQSIVFMLTIGLSHWQVIVGLLIGGMLAAPLAAYATKKIPTRPLMRMVGILIILLSIRTIILAL
jgi:uncharacterized membrane protein YfcA